MVIVAELRLSTVDADRVWQRVVANMSERHSGACELCLLAFLPHKSAQHKGRHVLRIAPYRCIKVSYLSCCRFHGHMV